MELRRPLAAMGGNSQNLPNDNNTIQWPGAGFEFFADEVTF